MIGLQWPCSETVSVLNGLKLHNQHLSDTAQPKRKSWLSTLEKLITERVLQCNGVVIFLMNDLMRL